MMYTEKRNIIDLVPSAQEGFRTGLFKTFGFAISDYLFYRGFTQDSSIDDVRKVLKDEFFIAASITNDTKLNDIKTWLDSNDGYSLVVLDFHNVALTAENDILLNLIESMLGEHLYDLRSYENRFSFCKKSNV